jgi:amino acid permease
MPTRKLGFRPPLILAIVLLAGAAIGAGIWARATGHSSDGVRSFLISLLVLVPIFAATLWSAKQKGKRVA